MQLATHLNDLADRVDKGLNEAVEIIECDSFPNDFYVEVPKWKRIEDVVALVADLKSSTKLNVNKHPRTSARIYEAVTGALVQAVKLSDFDSQFEQIQGDGLIALFHGERRYEQAFCAAVTIKTFSERSLVPKIRSKWGDDMPETGFKVGLASGTVLVKKVGVRGMNEPIWSGKPVNWATKCAQTADADELVVTQSVWNALKNNEYVSKSCGCGNPMGEPQDLWEPKINDRLPDSDRDCFALTSNWCPKHGETFATAILDGKTKRSSVKKAA